MRRPPALLFGVPIADVTMDEALDVLTEFVEIGRRDGRTFQVATPNIDFLANAVTDPDLHRILQAADLSLADGTPVVWSTRIVGTPIRERVAGSDLFPKLVERARSTGWRIHVLGSAPEVAERARALLATSYPGARVSIDPGPTITDPTRVDPGLVDSIRAADPDILCVALGNPKQERFIDAYRGRLGVPVLIGIGGTLDMLTGKRKRAPRWIQRIGLEWVVRALQEPARLGPRYARDIRIVGPRLWAESAARRRRSGGLAVDLAGDAVTLRIGGTHPLTVAEWRQAMAAIDAGGGLVVEAHADDLSGQAAAQLVGLVQQARLRRRPAGRPPGTNDAEQALRGFGVDVRLIAGAEGSSESPA